MTARSRVQLTKGSTLPPSSGAQPPRIHPAHISHADNADNEALHGSSGHSVSHGRRASGARVCALKLPRSPPRRDTQ